MSNETNSIAHRAMALFDTKSPHQVAIELVELQDQLAADAALAGTLPNPRVIEPDNLRTHRDSWQKALAHLVELEHDRNQREYWEHELRAMCAMYVDLDRLTAGRDTEWTDAASTPTAEDYRELQAQHDQLQSKYKAAMDTLGSAVKTAEFEGHANRPWRDYAKALLADNAPMPEPAVPNIVCPTGWVAVAEAVIEDHVVTEWDHRWQEISGYSCGYCSLSDDTSDGVVNGEHDPDCVITKARAMLAAAPKPEGAA